MFSECVKTALQCQSVTRGAVKYYIKAPALDTILNILNWSKWKVLPDCSGLKKPNPTLACLAADCRTDNSSHVSLQLISTKHRSDI